MFDKKSVAWFLLITFGLTWGVEGVLLVRGVSFERIPPILLQYAVAALVLAPAIGASSPVKSSCARVCGFQRHVCA